MQNLKLSVIVIAKDEEEMIRDCLERVTWAEEIILVDTGSTDKTLAIAKKTIPEIKIVKTKKGSFSDWRNLGLKKASGEWVFYVDADERVSPELKKEIKQVIQEEKYDYFIMPRLNNLLGKNMRYGGWYPDYVTRVFKRKKLIGWQGKIHESPIVKGKKGQLKNELLHIAHRSISTMVLKTIQWARLEAEQFYQQKAKPVSWYHLLLLPTKEFLRRVFWLQGFRDGIKGWIEGGMQAFSKFLTFAYLYQMQKGKSR